MVLNTGEIAAIIATLSTPVTKFKKLCLIVSAKNLKLYAEYH